MILIGVITSDVKDYCWDEFSSSLKAFPYPVLFVDNSTTQKNRHKIRKSGFECEYVNPNGKDIKKVMATCHDILRQRAIDMNCDLMHIESDIILKPNDIDELYHHNKPVIGFPYFVGFGREMKLMIQKLEEHQSSVGSVIYPYEKTMPTGGVERVFHCGLGALLISNWVLHEFRFRYEENDGDLHPDSIFARDLFYRNIPIFCDTSKVVKHLNKRHW